MSARRFSFSVLALPGVVAVLLTALIALNLHTLIGGSARIRAKDLAFFPSPVAARLLSLGQAGSAAKLRWIDSFAYFQYQLDRRDDALPDGSSGFARLYETLIALDPYFVPFYQHAALNLGAVAGRHDLALGMLLRGTMALPQVTELWRSAATELISAYDFERRQPQAFDAFLNQWVAAEATDNGKRMVWDWQAAMARRRFQGLEQLVYWQERLSATKPGTPASGYIESVIREQLARFGVHDLQSRADAYCAQHGLPPLLPLALTERTLGAPPTAWGPLLRVDDRVVLRTDPFGFPYELWAGTVSSPGLDAFRFRNKLWTANAALSAKLSAGAAYPDDLDGVRALGVALPDPPAAGAWTYVEHDLNLHWPAPPSPPWAITR